MKDYKRLTEKKGRTIKQICEHCRFNSKNKICNMSDCVKAVLERLAQLEDKIEQGNIKWTTK